VPQQSSGLRKSDLMLMSGAGIAWRGNSLSFATLSPYHGSFLVRGQMSLQQINFCPLCSSSCSAAPVGVSYARALAAAMN